MNVVWFRNDLRVADNPALVSACAHQEPVVALYIWVDEYQATFPIGITKKDFIFRQLRELRSSLEKRNIRLLVLRVSTQDEISALLQGLVSALGADSLFFNNEYPFYERERDRQVTQVLRAVGVSVLRYDDRVIVPPAQLRTAKGEPYKVFTPYKRQWLMAVANTPIEPLAVPKKAIAYEIDMNILSSYPQMDIDDVIRSMHGHSLKRIREYWPEGEKIAQKYLDNFIAEKINDYSANRDFPSIEGTSRLSPYLSIGALSPRQMVARLIEHFGCLGFLSEGASVWLSEIIWREFYNHLTVDFPMLSRAQPMQPKTVFFPWKGETAEYFAWCRGETGYPIIDAAMKQLLETGWMHNRLRMLVASFLCKNLQVDWRLGERFFMEHLIDGDFAANNGGWQWSASTGADAAPYFRVFNPVTQAKRFDASTEFVCHWLPELKSLPLKQRFDPQGSGYLPPIVDLKASRAQSIALFSQCN